MNLTTATFSRAARGLCAAALICAGAMANTEAASLTSTWGSDPGTTGYAAWDVFAGTYAGPHAPDSGSLDTSLTLTAAFTIPGFPPGVYTGDPAAQVTSTGNLYAGSTLGSFSLDGTSSLAGVQSILVQMVSGTVNNDSFVLKYNDVIYNPVVVATGNGARAWQYDLTGVSTPSGTAFELDFSASGPHFALNEIRVDFSTTSFQGVSMVPEPSGVMLAMAGGLSVFFIRRRRQ